jgi:thiamine-phosphate pyrophosphorylase
VKLIVISAPDPQNHEIEMVTQMFEHGLQNFHLRKPKYSTLKLSDYLQSIPEQYRDRVIVHSHHELAVKYNLKGVHITRSHKRRLIRTWLKLRLLKYQRPNLQFSTSIHRLSGLYRSSFGSKTEYVFLSPVFGSISKRGHEAGFDESQLRAAMVKTKHHVIALGGLDLEKMERIHFLGFEGMAFLGAIWKSDDPVATFKEVYDKFILMNAIPEDAQT